MSGTGRSEGQGSRSEFTVRAAFRRATGYYPDTEPGSVNWLSNVMAGRTGRVRAGGTTFFIKWSTDTTGREALYAEADGLRRLNEACPRNVVGLIGQADAEKDAGSILVLEHVDSGTPAADYDVRLARALAEIHATSADSFGLDRDNFIGSTPQVNGNRATWPEFFAEQRLISMARKLRDRDAWPAHWSRPFETLIYRLPDLLPARPTASLVHGDLWSGNVMTAADGRPTLIDPAVYYGHDETDLAMMKLFGGFG